MSDATDDRAALAGRRRAPDDRRRPISCRTVTTGARSRGRRRPSASTSYANGLLSLGVRKGDAFAILGRRTRRVGALRLRARPRSARSAPPIYANSSREGRRLHPRPLRVGRRALRGRDPAREGRGRPRRGIPRLRHVLTFADLDDLAARGRALRGRASERAARGRRARSSEDDLFTYIYTSGTTGPPKGCMISHRNYYAMVAVVDDLPSFTGPEDTMLLYLPLAHNFGRLMHLSGAVRRLRDRVPARPAAGGRGAARR